MQPQKTSKKIRALESELWAPNSGSPPNTSEWLVQVFAMLERLEGQNVQAGGKTETCPKDKHQ